MMTTDGTVVGDGSWQLNITVECFTVQQQVLQHSGEHRQTLRVNGDMHIGGVMLNLVDRLRNLGVENDWSDHGLWWPHKNKWLRRTRTTLDQYSVQADSELIFTPMHKILLVQLPDLQNRDIRVDFSRSVFDVVVKLCKELGIRHPEELSLIRKLTAQDLRKNQGVSATRSNGHHHPSVNSPHHLSNNSLDNSFPNSPNRQSPYSAATPQSTLARGNNYAHSPYGTLDNHTPNSPSLFNANGMSPASMNSLSFEGARDATLENTPPRPLQEGVTNMLRAKGPAEKARVNAGWLDSSRSLMEQGVYENNLVLLRFKFFNFYDLNAKYDKVRINQLYEQAKWTLLAENVACSDEQMLAFAALQVQVEHLARTPNGIEQELNDSSVADGGDDIDAALMDLEKSLDTTSVSTPTDLTQTPQLAQVLSLSIKSKKNKEIKKKDSYLVFKNFDLLQYNSAQESHSKPQLHFTVAGCEVLPEVKDMSKGKYVICVYVPTQDSMVELRLKIENEHTFAQWLAAFRLASRTKTMADSSYEPEVKDIENFLRLQRAGTGGMSGDHIPREAHNFVCPTTSKKFKSHKQLAQRILESQANVKEMTLTEAKLCYIRAWHALPKCDFAYFIVRFKNQKKEELLGITPTRLVRMTLDASEDVVQTYRFDKMDTWNVNWHAKMMIVHMESDESHIKKKEAEIDGENHTPAKTHEISFQCMTADCKVVHEFIGGYMFLAMRSGEKNQTLNQELFHKLTGGRE